jgi:hypothetical protein
MPVKYRVLEAMGKAGGGRRRGGNGKEARVRGVMRECVARVSADRASKARRDVRHRDGLRDDPNKIIL